MSRALVIDGNNRLYAAYFAFEALSSNGLSTACIYGMPSMLKALINEIRPDDIYIVWDGHKNAKGIRKSILPTYKEHRSSNALVDIKDLIRQKKVVMKMFKYLGVKQVVVPELEGDDTLYTLLEKIKPKYDKIILNTADKDFNQCITKQVHIYRQTRTTVMVTHKNAYEQFGYHPHETVDWLSILGDKSDDIPGVKGAGEKTARGLLDKYGSLANFMDTNDDFPRLNRNALLEVYELNRELIDLKIFYNKHIKNKIKLSVIGGMNPPFNLQKFNQISVQHGVTKFLDANFPNTFKRLL